MTESFKKTVEKYQLKRIMKDDLKLSDYQIESRLNALDKSGLSDPAISGAHGSIPYSITIDTAIRIPQLIPDNSQDYEKDILFIEELQQHLSNNRHDMIEEMLDHWHEELTQKHKKQFENETTND